MSSFSKYHPLWVMAVAGGCLTAYLAPSDGQRRGQVTIGTLVPPPPPLEGHSDFTKRSQLREMNRAGESIAQPGAILQPNPSPPESSRLGVLAGDPPPGNGAVETAWNGVRGPADRQPPNAAARARLSATLGSTVPEADTAESPPLSVPYSMDDPDVLATIPAALADPVSSLDAAGAAEIERLADTFLQQIAGDSEDPRDAGQQQRWAGAQMESDARMRASLGGQAWLHHHREAHRQAMETRPEAVAPR